MSRGVVEYLESDLKQAQAHLESFKKALVEHLATDFNEIEADLHALIAHGSKKVAALKEQIAALTTAV
jgi:uncharacterized membrane-anchored protein YhcB (DUF1043 family)